MIFTQQQVWQSVKATAPIFKLDSHLIMAINEQECEHNIGTRGHRVFDVEKYDASVPRLEQSYLDHYTRDFQYSTVVEGLLAMSYGTMQVMGESLRECKNEQGKNFYEWHFSRETIPMQNTYANAMSSLNVASALDLFCADLNIGIEWGCRWFVEMQKRSGNQKPADWLLKWNGGSNLSYPGEVLERIARLKIQCI